MEEFWELVKCFSQVMSGDVMIGTGELVIQCKKIAMSIPSYLFYHNFKSVIEGLEDKNTVSRKVGKKLAQSSYGEEYGYTLLHYINAYEHKDKGTFMAYLIDSVSKDFITPNECFLYCKIINDVSLRSLFFLRDNVKKMELCNPIEYMDIINELKRNGLMYDSCNGYAFELEAFFLDKYSLSYETEKYSYFEKMGGIPQLNKFPRVTQVLRVGETAYRE